MIPLFKVLMSPSAKEAVAEVLESGYIGQGPKVELFEHKLAAAYGRPVLTMSSCTAALDLALHLADVEPGDLVASTPQTCSATTAVVVNRRAIPFWCDIDPLTGLIDPNDVRKRLLRARGRVKAIMAVDWAGRVCDYRSLKEIGATFGIPVIQDAAHLGPQPLSEDGAGDFSCFSYQAIKILTTADGGAIATPSAEAHKRAELLRWYGLDRKSSASDRCAQNIQESGYKAHMNDVAAAIGLANLPDAKRAVDVHRRNAAFYHEELEGLPGVTTPPPDADSSWWLYTLLVLDRDGFIKFLADRGIMASPVHLRTDKHDAYYYPSGQLLGVDYFSSREVAIPVGWWLSDEDRKAVVEAVATWARR